MVGFCCYMVDDPSEIRICCEKQVVHYVVDDIFVTKYFGHSHEKMFCMAVAD